jgi:hypothetical protein
VLSLALTEARREERRLETADRRASRCSLARCLNSLGGKGEAREAQLCRRMKRWTPIARICTQVCAARPNSRERFPHREVDEPVNPYSGSLYHMGPVAHLWYSANSVLAFSTAFFFCAIRCRLRCTPRSITTHAHVSLPSQRRVRRETTPLSHPQSGLAYCLGARKRKGLTFVRSDGPITERKGS